MIDFLDGYVKKSIMLQINQRPLFATQIYYEKLQKGSALIQLVKSLKKEIYQVKSADLIGQKWSQKNYPQGYTSYGSSQDGYDRLHFISPYFQDLEKKIRPHLKSFIQALDLDLRPQDLKMTHCWVNVMGKGSFHTSHAHPLSVVSGTFYVDIPPRASALKFEDPRMGLFMNTPPIRQKSKLQNQRYIEIQPANGYLVLFESWLKHEVPLNLSQKERLSISFNYGWS